MSRESSSGAVAHLIDGLIHRSLDLFITNVSHLRRASESPAFDRIKGVLLISWNSWNQSRSITVSMRSTTMRRTGRINGNPASFTSRSTIAALFRINVRVRCCAAERS